MIDTVIRAEKNKAQDKIDILFVLLILLLCGIGLTTLFSGSVSSGARFFGDPLYFIKRQLFNFVIGFIALLFFASVRLEVIRKYLPKIVIFTLIISILTFIPGIGIKKNGAARWIG
ncbi:MAG TPA: FtsW/RodA/SpoVE family cell cycle protein, partial [Treponemataceae bacterium]|nr:FtsW/RodA/SpoVE family cell cycle protein [Treponemataceae bacterium]